MSQWISGFVRELSGALTLSPEPSGTWQTGFLRDSKGRLVTTAGTSPVINIEEAPYSARPDAFFTDGEATSASTTFKSATASFTSEDVGKTIVVLRAGASSAQDHHSTIAEVLSSTEVKMANTAGRTQTSCRFYISRGGDALAAIQAAVNAASAAGGGTVVLKGPGYLVSGSIVLKDRVTIEGSGIRTTMIHLAASANVPVVYSDYTENFSASTTGIRRLWIDGNRGRQADITTTLASNYTAGNTTISLTSAAAFLPTGAILIGTNRLHYTKITGNTLEGVIGGREGTTDASATSGTTVTHNKAHGIYLTRRPLTAGSNTEDTYDPHHLVENVMVNNCKGDGISAWGQSEMRFHNVWVRYADNFGFRPAFDSWLSNCTSESSGRAGFYLLPSELLLSNCKAFFSGGNVAAEGHGFFFDTNTQPATGMQVLSSCIAQDNKAHGFNLWNCDRASLAACAADSNSTSSSGGFVGVNLHGANNCDIDVICVERKQDGTNNWQKNALLIDANSSGNRIRVTHAASSTGAVESAIKSGSALGGGNDLSINGMGGTKTPIFAAEYTPDPYAATTHIVGALTGNITIKKPSNEHLGCPLRFIFLQDGTGGRTITWNEAFSTTYADTGNTLNKKLIIEFIYNAVSSKWQQVYISQSATAGTYWI